MHFTKKIEDQNTHFNIELQHYKGRKIPNQFTFKYNFSFS